MRKNCEICRKSFKKPHSCSLKGWKKQRFCSVKCKQKWMSITFRGPNNWSWKGGSITTQGYRCIWQNGGRILEHRLVMQNHIGRKLKRTEIVHHMNGDKLDNRIDNLHLYKSVSEHNRHHYPKGALFGVNHVRAQ